MEQITTGSAGRTDYHVVHNRSADLKKKPLKHADTPRFAPYSFSDDENHHREHSTERTVVHVEPKRDTCSVCQEVPQRRDQR